ncbi:lytic murein transglycosylase B [Salinibius halmophilus]|uniref:lytic murein transglycosylase B n=1 Tax=Salinibius halmophilus TaxID=1853216 RepID=UPI000E66DB6D|nr:lytic murein transglycosylase B [Salinibius halmophilus]
MRKLIAALAVCASATASAWQGTPQGEALVARLQAEVDVPSEWLAEALKDLPLQDSIVERFQKAPERTATAATYRPIFVEPARIKRGEEFLAEHREVLERASAEYGIPPSVIMAILAMETNFGGYTGRHPTLASLVTLSLHHPSRNEFFERELKAYLALTHSESIDPKTINGSYAGAMGLPQFMPTSYQAYAVDFDADGKRDIWQNPADAIGSIGNYLGNYGWQADLPAAVRARVSGDTFNDIAGRSFRPSTTVAAVSDYGWQPVINMDSDVEVSPIRVEGEHGTEFWLGTQNLRTIARYNPSLHYAMTVFLLSQRFEELM